jgi:hypothetical protein
MIIIEKITIRCGERGTSKASKRAAILAESLAATVWTTTFE